MNLLREYIRELFTEATKLPGEYFSVIDEELSRSQFWKKTNSQNDIDIYESESGMTMATPAAEALSVAISSAIHTLNLDMDILVRSHDTDDIEEMTLHPAHPAWPNRWLIEAKWYVSKNRPGRNTIDITMMTSEKGDKILSSLNSGALVRHIAQTIRHELVHYTQMKKQSFKKGLYNDIKAFDDMLKDPRQVPDEDNSKYWDVYSPTGKFDEAGEEIIHKEGFNNVLYTQDYLKSHIEIDAHAHDAAEELVAVYDDSKIKDILRGNVDMSDSNMPNAILHYFEVLGPNDKATHKFLSKLYTQVKVMQDMGN